MVHLEDQKSFLQRKSNGSLREKQLKREKKSQNGETASQVAYSSIERPEEQEWPSMKAQSSCLGILRTSRRSIR